MKKWLLVVICILFVGGLLLIFNNDKELANTDGQQGSNEKANVIEEVHKSIKMKLTIPKSKYAQGETIEISGTAENIDDKDYVFGGDPCKGKLGIYLEDEEGVRPPGTGDIAGEFCIQSYQEHTFPVGEKLTAKAGFNDLEPGMYKVVLTYAGFMVEDEVRVEE